VTFGWSILLAFHAYHTFASNCILDDDRDEKKTRELMEKGD
jgi:hypothetical protein